MSNVPSKLEQDLKYSRITITCLTPDGEPREIQVVRPMPDIFGFDGVHIELRPFLVITVGVCDTQDPSGDHYQETIAELALDDAVNIEVKNEPEYGSIVPVCRWLRDRQGKWQRIVAKMPTA